MYRAPNGRILHASLTCPCLRAHQEYIQVGEVRRCDRRCHACFPTCMVCLTDVGDIRPSGCPRQHAVCSECMVLHLRRDTDAPPACPCGEGPLDLQKDLPRPIFERWWRERLARNNNDRSEAPIVSVLSAGGILASLSDEAHARRCPKCGRRFLDFDGCAALSCACGTTFCALCFEGFDDARRAHRHVAMQCPLNLNHRGTFFIPFAQCEHIWSIQTRIRAHALLAQLRMRDGLLVSLLLRVLLLCRDAGLRSPRPPIRRMVGDRYFLMGAMTPWVCVVAWWLFKAWCLGGCSLRGYYGDESETWVTQCASECPGGSFGGQLRNWFRRDASSPSF